MYRREVEWARWQWVEQQCHIGSKRSRVPNLWSVVVIVGTTISMMIGTSRSVIVGTLWFSCCWHEHCATELLHSKR